MKTVNHGIIIVGKRRNIAHPTGAIWKWIQVTVKLVIKWSKLQRLKRFNDRKQIKEPLYDSNMLFDNKIQLTSTIYTVLSSYSENDKMKK